MGVTLLVFAVELQKVRIKCIFSDFWERSGASFRIECMWKGIYIEISHLGHNLIKKAFKWKSKWVSTNFKNIHYRGFPWGSRTQQDAYCLRYAHSHHIESHLGKKQPQAKIAITFLFSQLHFNNVTSHALFTGAILLCAVRDAQCKTSLAGVLKMPHVSNAFEDYSSTNPLNKE